jgi:dipeptidyl aminopeptidase/acylaminoacyl peptidase
MKYLITTLAAFALSAIAHAADDKPSIETFFKLPQYTGMQLSPDGTRIVALAPVNGHQNIVVLDVDTRKATPVTGLVARDIVRVSWLNSKRLLFVTGKLGARDDDQTGGGLFAIDADGANSRQLGESSDEPMGGGGKIVVRPLSIVRLLPGEGDEFIAREIVFDTERIVPGALFRVNSRTGRRTALSVGKPDSSETETWVVDPNGIPRAFIATSGNKTRIYYRKAEDAPWEKLDEFSSLSGTQWLPLAVGEDGKNLLVSSWRGRDKAAIVRYDVETKSFGEVIAAHPQVDLTDLVFTNGKAVGVRYEADKGGVAWFEEDLAKVQSAIDKALPDSVNILSWSRDRQRFVVTAVSDVSPGSFYIFDKKSGKIEWLADALPWIDAKKMSHVTPVRYTARDGLEIPAYLTVPKGSSGKNLPMVAMIHGGPWLDGDNWYYNPEVQFLASRGYAVLQPNFRGTTHYGWKHFSSSFKQWGLAMQDDITDGVQWAIASGVADPKRICIYGASYGGYATMMGLAKTPDLFKCGINYVGVTDLNLFATATWSDFAHSDFIYSMKDTVGDLVNDTERLKTTSPVLMAARIKAPVFMAYGASDVRVVPEHGTRMKAALERVGQKPQWMIAEGEGHGYRDMKNQVMFYGAMEKFLDENIGH